MGFKAVRVGTYRPIPTLPYFKPYFSGGDDKEDSNLHIIFSRVSEKSLIGEENGKPIGRF